MKIDEYFFYGRRHPWTTKVKGPQHNSFTNHCLRNISRDHTPCFEEHARLRVVFVLFFRNCQYLTPLINLSERVNVDLFCHLTNIETHIFATTVSCITITLIFSYTRPTLDFDISGLTLALPLPKLTPWTHRNFC